MCMIVANTVIKAWRHKAEEAITHLKKEEITMDKDNHTIRVHINKTSQYPNTTVVITKKEVQIISKTSMKANRNMATTRTIISEADRVSRIITNKTTITNKITSTIDINANKTWAAHLVAL